MKQELNINILLEELNNWKPQDPTELIHIGQKQMAMILDYITNLQKELNMFKTGFGEMSKNYFGERSNNEKAR